MRLKRSMVYLSLLLILSSFSFVFASIDVSTGQRSITIDEQLKAYSLVRDELKTNYGLENITFNRIDIDPATDDHTKQYIVTSNLEGKIFGVIHKEFEIKGVINEPNWRIEKIEKPWYIGFVKDIKNINNI